MTAIDWRNLWKFLDYSGDQFAQVQSNSLREQFGAMSNNPAMAQLSAGGTDFTSIDDFRARVRLSTWDDYSTHLNPNDPNSSDTWAYTQFGAGNSKWAPFNRQALDHLADSVVASIGLAASTDGKSANINYGDRALFNIPPDHTWRVTLDLSWHRSTVSNRLYLSNLVKTWSSSNESQKDSPML